MHTNNDCYPQNNGLRLLHMASHVDPDLLIGFFSRDFSAISCSGGRYHGLCLYRYARHDSLHIFISRRFPICWNSSGWMQPLLVNQHIQWTKQIRDRHERRCEGYISAFINHWYDELFIRYETANLSYGKQICQCLQNISIESTKKCRYKNYES